MGGEAGEEGGRGDGEYSVVGGEKVVVGCGFNEAVKREVENMCVTHLVAEVLAGVLVVYNWVGVKRRIISCDISFPI